MLNALQSVISVILMIGLGYLLARRGWFDAGAGNLISRLVVSIALPAYMISNLMGGYDRTKLLSMAPGLPIPFLVMGLSYLIADGIARITGVRKDRRGAFMSMFALSNSVFIGLPVNLLLFGDASLPYALLYYIANTTTFWTLGVYGIAKDGALRKGTAKPSLISLSGLRRIFSPPLAGFFTAVILIMLGIRLPRPIMDSCRYLGNMTTPLSMLFIGIVIARVDWKTLRFERDFLLICAGRFILTPALMFGFVLRADFPQLMKQVFIMQSAMPAMTQNPILAEAYGADSEYTAIGTSLTTVLSMATIPLYMTFVGWLF